MTTQAQYNVLRLSNRNYHVRLDLLNEEDIVVSSLEGIAVGGRVSLSGESVYRRSGNLSMVFDKKYNIIPSPSSKIWFNKRIRLHVGIENYQDEVVWFDLGKFAITNVDLNLDKSEKTLSCSLQDYMAFLDGTLGGKLTHKTVIQAGTPIDEAIKGVARQFGKVSVENMKIGSSTLLTPYTIEKDAGSNAFDLIKELALLYMGYDFYYNADGYLIVEKIKDTKNDPIVEHFTGEEEDLSINYVSNYDFTNVKNIIQVWGKQLDSGEQIKYRFANKYKRNNFSALSNIVDMENGDICYIESEKKSYAWFNTWTELDFNVIPIFNIEAIGEKPETFTEENIFDVAQARLRCEYELIKQSNMLEKISFNVIPLYNLDINQKIMVTIPDVSEGEYSINTINVGLEMDSTMSIAATKLYY